MPSTPPDDPGRDAAREARNTAWLECHQIVVRVGWIFKTETVIMPAVLDAVVDSGVLRGLLPVLKRGGQSIPPLLTAARLARRPRKKWALVRATAAMAACFAVLAAAWEPLRDRPDVLAVVFLVLYALFAMATGLAQLAAAALQGKLVPPAQRGRALVVGGVVGGGLAIAAAIALLGPWLESADGFPRIFAATAAFFALAAVVPVFLDEPADPSPPATDGPAGGHPPHGWRKTLAGDPALRWLTLAAACFAAVIMLFPHYQAFARARLGTPPASLLAWVVVQNVATGAASLVAGPLADRRGTRIALVGLVAFSALAPVVVTGLSLLPPPRAAAWFWVTYAVLGLNPLTLRMFTNYALELAPRAADHAAYVSVVNAALALPFVCSPLVGLAVDAIGFRPVFLAGAVVIGAGALAAARLPEPRLR